MDGVVPAKYYLVVNVFFPDILFLSELSMPLFFVFIINRPGVAGAILQTALSFIKSFIHSFIHSWFVKIYLRRRHAPTVGHGAFTHKIG